MLWQLTLAGVPGALFDDTIPGAPDDPTFTTALIVAAVAGSAGAADGYNFVGQSPADKLES